MEGHLRQCGALTVRFRIRDGESDLIQLGEEEGEGESSKGKTDNDNNGVVGEDGDKRDVVRDGDEEILSRVSMERDKGEESDDLYDPISSVPDIFFRPYFDLTDPGTFDRLMLADVDVDRDRGRGKDDFNSGGIGGKEE